MTAEQYLDKRAASGVDPVDQVSGRRLLAPGY